VGAETLPALARDPSCEGRMFEGGVGLVVELIELRAATVKTDGGAECAAAADC
jgi:hypothetical protein